MFGMNKDISAYLSPISKMPKRIALLISCAVSGCLGVAMSSWITALLSAGLFMGAWYLLSARQQRDANQASSPEILSELPQFLEIVALAAQAGLSFEAALRLYIDSSPGRLQARLNQALAHSRLGLASTEQALITAAQDLESSELESILCMVFESLHYGVPLAHVLERQIDLLRSQLRAQAQERLERAPIWMLLPTATLILPAMLLAVIGPLLASAFIT